MATAQCSLRLAGLWSRRRRSGRLWRRSASPGLSWPTRRWVYLDQQPVRPMGVPNKRTANHVNPGSHTVVIQQNGQVLSRHTLDVPDGANVMVRVSPTGTLQVSGATATSGGGQAPPPAAGSGSGSAGESALTAAQRADQLAPEESSDSFDMNEGAGGGGDVGGDPNRLAGGDREQFPGGDDHRTGARRSGRARSRRLSGGLGGAGRGIHGRELDSHAESGGFVRSGGSGFRQGRPVPPRPTLGWWRLPASQDPIVVYLEGFVIASVGLHQRRSQSLRSGATSPVHGRADGRYIYRGVVEIQSETVTLEIADAHPPKALDHDWAWSPR